jgi:lipid-binding SYLF domain-containing protein
MKGKFFNVFWGRVLPAAVLLGFLQGCVTPKGETPEDKRAYIRDMKVETISKLVNEKPSVRQSLEQSVGYGVFTNVNIKIMAVGSGQGYGIVIDNETGQETFMRMAELGLGFGLGAKDISTVFIFHDRRVFDEFVEKGWSFGAEATASAKSENEGGAAAGEVSFSQAVEVYQLTKAGLMASAMISGTKYWKDNSLR